MKVKYLGTGAYEGVPSLFCKCRVCRKSMESGGRNLRSRSQALVNDELLIDFPADTVWHFHRYGFDWDKIGDCIITHGHSDHIYPEDIEMANKAYSNEHRPLRFHTWRDGCNKLHALAWEACGQGDITISLIEPGKYFHAGENGKYTILPLWANHDETVSSVIYSIACEGKRFLYGNDTGIFPENTWEGLRKEGRYDLVSLDCTGCLGLGGGWRDGHMSLQTNLEVLERMRQENLIDEKTVVVVTHFSHNGGQTYNEMVPEADRHGIIVAYDGMEIEI